MHWADPWIQCAAPPGHRPAEPPPHHSSVPCSLIRLRRPATTRWLLYRSSTSSIYHPQTGGYLTADYAVDGKNSPDKTSSKLIRRWRMFRRSPKTVRTGGTRWRSVCNDKMNWPFFSFNVFRDGLNIWVSRCLRWTWAPEDVQDKEPRYEPSRSSWQNNNQGLLIDGETLRFWGIEYYKPG